jgi:steroid 5-alpha reductase family enzyme
MNFLWFLPLFVFLYMSFWFFVSLRKKRYDVIDVAWGPGFIFLSLLALYFREAPLDGRSIWLLVLMLLWGTRLLIHTYRRNLNKEEDWRYHEWHDSKSCRYSICTYVQVFLFQAALMMIISLPVVYSLRLIVLSMFDVNYLGLVLAALGLLLETIADQQRFTFLKKGNNRKKGQEPLMTTGLWRFSRHPNYFGEIIFWWGIYILVLGTPNSWMMIFSPLLLSYILLFVSGLPTEKKYKARADFIEYKRKTSPLIPWWPKK